MFNILTIFRHQAGAELGQAQLKLELDFTADESADMSEDRF